MMHPMRVEWSAPDEAKREAARQQVERALSPGMRLDTSLHRALAATPRHEHPSLLVKHFPDLQAVVVQFGTLLSIRYVPEQWGLRTFARGGVDLGTTGSQGVLLCKAKWVALVATQDGTREMDPLTLRVMWPCSAGDPIAGVVTAEELAKRGLQ